jgi:NADH-quinone oxidoreductase subunit I
MIGIVKGLLTTLSTFSRKPVTIQYPDEKHPLPIRERSFPILLWDFAQNEPMCTGCNICVRNCPVDCMFATMVDNPHFGKTSDKKKVVEKFYIDYARCMRCNICVEVCPFDAIVMDNDWSGHEHSVYDRMDLHLDIDDLLAKSRAGEVEPFFPQDNIIQLEARLKGEEIPEPKGMNARHEAFEAFMRKVTAGEATLAEVTGLAPGASAPGAAGPAVAAPADGAQPKGDPMSPSKQRARRTGSEREAKKFAEENNVPEDMRERFIKRAGELGRLGLKRDQAVERARQELEAGTLPEDGIGTPPPDLAGTATGTAGAGAGAAGGDAGAKGDPMSPSKQRARRTGSEREAKKFAEENNVPEDVRERFITRAGEIGRLGAKRDEAVLMAKQELDAGTLPEDGIGTPPAGVGGATGGTEATNIAGGTSAAAPAEEAGGKGDPMSPQKQRARRMRAQRAAKALGEERGMSGEALEKFIERAGELGRLGAKADDAATQALAEIGG